MRILQEHFDDKTGKLARVWYSPAKQEYYVEYNDSGRLDAKFMLEQEAVDSAEEHVSRQEVTAVLKPRSLNTVPFNKPTLDDGDENFD